MTAPAGPASSLRLRPPHHRIDRRAVTWWILQSLALYLPIMIGLSVAYGLW
jgi:hypothetical protein